MTITLGIFILSAGWCAYCLLCAPRWLRGWRLAHPKGQQTPLPPQREPEAINHRLDHSKVGQDYTDWLKEL